MKTILRFEFDNTGFLPRDHKGPWSIKFTDPPVVPTTGDKVHIRMEEFLNDPDVISNFEEQSEGKVYFAERLNTIYGKNEIEVIVVLYEEATFKQFFPRYFIGELTA
jgi:hypothetical protein